MKFYPIHIDLKDKPCLVVGGGRVAERKIKKLCLAGATVTVISKDFTPAIEHLQQAKKIKTLSRTFQSGDVKGYFLVFAATNNQTVNLQVCREAGAKGILVNSVDGVDQGSFILPATCQVGALQVGITTNGESPALSARLRRYFQAKLLALTPQIVAEVGQLRTEMVTAADPHLKERAAQKMNLAIDQLIEALENQKVNVKDI